MDLRSHGWRVVVALFLAAVPSCDSGNDSGRDEAGPDDVAEIADPGAEAALDTVTGNDTGLDEAAVDTVTGATKLMLTDAHGGWQQPACWSCHAADDHNDGKDPYLCVGCHGTNGAPAGHGGATPCSGCHSPAPHGEEGFPDPLSCKTCHGS